MRLRDLIVVALRGVLVRPTRSFLTMLTAAVGIAGVTSAVALSDGITYQVQRDVRSLGLRVIEVLNPAVLPKKAGAVRAELGPVQLAAIRAEFPDRPVAPTRIWPYLSFFQGSKEASVTIGIATDHNMAAMFDVGMERGRFFDESEASRGARVCVLDGALAKKAFPGQDPVGKSVLLWYGVTPLALEVIGVVEDPLSLREHLENFDTVDPARQFFARAMAYRNLYFPIKLLPKGESYLHTIKIAAAKPEDVGAMHARIKEILGPDFAKTTWSQKEWADIMVSTTDEFSRLGNLLWVSILVVTSLMIGTVNLIAIRERFREVGVRMTEGATPAAIWLQLTLENTMITMVGGLLGILLGIPVGWFLSRVVAGWEPAFTVKGLLLPVGVAFLLGVASTFWPAYKAARVNIVEIMRKT